jgi:hypothetical protein
VWRVVALGQGRHGERLPEGCSPLKALDSEARVGDADVGGGILLDFEDKEEGQAVGEQEDEDHGEVQPLGVAQAQPHHIGDDVLAGQLRLPRHHRLKFQSEQVVLVSTLCANTNHIDCVSEFLVCIFFLIQPM